MQAVNTRALTGAERLLRTLFVDARQAHVHEAPFIAVELGERGYRPVHTGLTLEDMNLTSVPPDVTEAAIIGSMFGWDVRGARPAVRWFREVRKEYIA